MLSLTLLLILLFLVVVASFYDLLTYTIPNTLNLAIAAVFPLYAFAAGLGMTATGLHLAIAFAILVAGILMFAAGWIGGGDAKLAAAIALWYGPTQALLEFFVVSAIAGAALGLALLSLRRIPLPPALFRYAWVGRLHDTRMGVPYGVAFGIGLVSTIGQLMAIQGRLLG